MFKHLIYILNANKSRRGGQQNYYQVIWGIFFLGGSYWTCITPSSKVWLCCNFLHSIPCSPCGSNKCVPLRPHIWQKALFFGTCSFYPADLLHIQYITCCLALFLKLFGENMPYYRIETLYIFMGLSSLITGAWALSLLWMSNIHKYFCEEIPDP